MENMLLEALYELAVDNSEFIESEEYKKKREEQHKISCKLEQLIGRDNYLEIDDFVTESEVLSEQYGFIIGFKYAVNLMKIKG